MRREHKLELSSGITDTGPEENESSCWTGAYSCLFGVYLDNFPPFPLLLEVPTGIYLKGTLHCGKTLLQRGPGRNKANISALLPS